MAVSDEDIDRMLQAGEDSGCEFKQVEFRGDRPVGPKRDVWADEIAAFANADGGVLLCGVTDAGDVQDMSREQIRTLDALLVEVSTDVVKPPVRIRTHHAMRADGKRLLVLDVPRGDTQHDSPGGSYIRVGGTKRRMTSDERQRLAQNRGHARFPSFDERTIPDTGFGTLDEALWKPLLSAEGAAAPEAALGRLTLLAPDEAGVTRATVAGVLLCTRNPERWLPNARIAATRYRGADRASGQCDAQDITGPLNEQIAAAVAFAVRNMRVAARKEPARVDMPEYSDKALFEALVNAVAHRDYSMRGSKIRLSMFADRVEIQSPGALPNNLGLDSMAERQATRNEVLTSVLGRMPVGGAPGSQDRRYFMERRGDGVPIILRETRELCGRPAMYDLIDGAELRLVIPAAGQDHSPARAVVTVRSGGQPLAEADLLVLFPNKTWKQARTNADGEATVDLHTTSLPMTVFAAAPGHAAHRQTDWLPSRGALAIELDPLTGGGAVIFPEATGEVPGLSGRLNPVRDALDRTHLYAANITINDGVVQPAHFLLGEELVLTDMDGRRQRVSIVDVVGRSALVEYRAA